MSDEEAPAKPFKCPTYKAGDPRIEETFRRGSGVGIDYSGLSSEEITKWGRKYAEMMSGSAAGVRTSTPVYRDVELQAMNALLPDNERFPQDDEDDDTEEG